MVNFIFGVNLFFEAGCTYIKINLETKSLLHW